ncbi:MAG: PilZ domain-containing protein [Chitinispirillaceae bacterium]|nr:PilZ domain-containing protein [Chitinispirillaceae bacterium]
MRSLEKRKSPRIIVDFVSVEVYATADGTARETEMREICTVRNISEIGMMFESEKPFDTGTVLLLTFALPDSPIVIRTNAIVVHSSRKKLFETGVQFKNLAIAEQKLLQHFIRREIVKNEEPEQEQQ